MKAYRAEQRRQARNATVSGILLTAVLHAAAFAVALHAGLRYLDPPPPETSFLIDFSDEAAVHPTATRIGRQPQADAVEPARPVELTQQAQAPAAAPTRPDTPETPPDDFGDIDAPTPPADEPPRLDPRASFPGVDRNNTAASAPKAPVTPTETYKTGQPDGNTDRGRTTGTANAHLQGRTVIGSLPRPDYSSQKEGTVVVRIKVDQYGNVTEAVPGIEGTTVTDKTLWNAARKAAMGAHFSQSAEAPVIQTGTITYIFKLQ